MIEEKVGTAAAQGIEPGQLAGVHQLPCEGLLIAVQTNRENTGHPNYLSLVSGGGPRRVPQASLAATMAPTHRCGAAQRRKSR